MLQWAPYPFVRITLSLIAGILLYEYGGKEFSYATEFFAFFVVIFVVAVVLARKTGTTLANNLAGITGLLCFFAAGIWLPHIDNERNDPQHLINLKEEPAYYTGTVSDYVLQKTGYQSTVLTVEQVLRNGKWQVASGKVQLSVPDDTVREYQLSYGDQLLIKGAPVLIAPPSNPAQFDYQAFLANKNVYHRHYLQGHQYQKIGFSPQNYVLHYSIQLRRKLDSLLKLNLPDRREYGISSALVLGVKDEIDNSVRDAYAGTGTMHVLAVSGLHVGLIYGLLMLILARFQRSYRQRVIVAFMVLAVLWGYAFMTGLSPSVLRAVVMLSTVAVAGAITRRHNIYNTLAFAAFLLLWYNPFYLFEVSFQLSFLAVLGIVYLQPRFYNLLQFENNLADKLWALFTVSVAAQLATMPLGIYYFHQFPVYFWLANLIVVPAATLVLYLGVAALALSWLPLAGALLFKLHYWFIWGMNEFNLLLTGLPYAILSGLTITELQAWLLYALLLLLILFFAAKKLRFLVLAVGAVAVLVVQQVTEMQAQQEQQLLSVYSLRGNTAVAFVEGRNATLLAGAGLTAASSDFKFSVQPHFWQLGLQQPQVTDLYSAGSQISSVMLPDSNSIVVWNGLKLLLLSKTPQFLPEKATAFDYLLLSQNVRLKAGDLDQIRVKKAILDTSNSPWHTARLQKQLNEAGIPFHDVLSSGAFVLKLK